MTHEGLEIEIPDQLQRGKITDYLESGEIIDVKYYEGSARTVQALLRDMPKKWYYTKVAQLSLNKEQKARRFGLINLGSSPSYYVEKI
jgi:hypothetical protein